VTTTIENQDQLEKLRTARAPVDRTLPALVKAQEPGLTTRELDDPGRGLPRDADPCSRLSPERRFCPPVP